MICLSLFCGRPEVFQADYSFEILQGYALPCPGVAHAGLQMHPHSGPDQGVGIGGNWPRSLTPRGYPVMIIVCFKYNTPLKNCDSEAIQEYKFIFRCCSEKAYIYWFLCNSDLLPVFVVTTECKYFCFCSMQIYLNFTCNFFLIIDLLTWVWLATRASRLLHKVANTIILVC